MALLEGVNREDMRRHAWLAYASLAAGTVFYVLAIWLEVWLDTRPAAPTGDIVLESHRQWRLRSSFLLLVWSVLGGISLPFGFGWLFLIPAWLWYVVRTTRGAILLARGHPVGVSRPDRSAGGILIREPGCSPPFRRGLRRAPSARAAVYVPGGRRQTR